MNLIDLRREMDETDRALLALFARRMALSGAIARVKQGAHLPILDPRREEEKLHQAADSYPRNWPNMPGTFTVCLWLRAALIRRSSSPAR